MSKHTLDLFWLFLNYTEKYCAVVEDSRVALVIPLDCGETIQKSTSYLSAFSPTYLLKCGGYFGKVNGTLTGVQGSWLGYLKTRHGARRKI